MTAATHKPCCSSHNVDMDCDTYRRTHFVQVGSCCEAWQDPHGGFVPRGCPAGFSSECPSWTSTGPCRCLEAAVTGPVPPYHRHRLRSDMDTDKDIQEVRRRLMQNEHERLELLLRLRDLEAAESDAAPVVWRIAAVPEGAEAAMIGQRYRIDRGALLWWNHNAWDPSMFSSLDQMAAAGYRLVEDTDLDRADVTVLP